MKILFCAFNMDTACVELRLTDGTLISIDCTAVENEIADKTICISGQSWTI
jgi:hypothetical protein